MTPEQYRAIGKAAEWTVVLPWPAKELSPNARLHWKALARKKKSARRTAWGAALSAHLPKIEDGTPIRVTTTFFPPDRRSYDEDNLKARMKAAYDGIADALGVDDRYFRHAPITIAAPAVGGKVEVEIGPLMEEPFQ
jgi:crossover junction endodeoxyribonuclease RusA